MVGSNGRREIWFSLWPRRAAGGGCRLESHLIRGLIIARPLVSMVFFFIPKHCLGARLGQSVLLSLELTSLWLTTLQAVGTRILDVAIAFDFSFCAGEAGGRVTGALSRFAFDGGGVYRLMDVRGYGDLPNWAILHPRRLRSMGVLSSKRGQGRICRRVCHGVVLV